MTVSAGDLLKVTAEMSYAGSIMQNVYHLTIDTGADDQDILDDIRDWMSLAYEHIDGLLATTLAFTRILVTDLSAEQDVGITDWLTPDAGTGSGDGMPPGVAALCTFPTFDLGHRGRKFIPGLTESHITASQLLSTTAVTALLAYADEVASPWSGLVTSAGFFPVIVHIDPVPGGVNYVRRTIASFSVSNIPAYQRRRKQGVGI